MKDDLTGRWVFILRSVPNKNWINDLQGVIHVGPRIEKSRKVTTTYMIVSHHKTRKNYRTIINTKRFSKTSLKRISMTQIKEIFQFDNDKKLCEKNEKKENSSLNDSLIVLSESRIDHFQEKNENGFVDVPRQETSQSLDGKHQKRKDEMNNVHQEKNEDLCLETKFHTDGTKSSSNQEHTNEFNSRVVTKKESSANNFLNKFDNPLLCRSLLVPGSFRTTSNANELPSNTPRLPKDFFK
jgi:hypothetical protein